MPASGCRARLRALVLMCAALVASAALLACGDDDGDSPSAKGASTNSTDSVAAAKKAVEKGYAGTDRALPKDGPKALGERKNVWVIACTMEGEGCARPAQAAAEAAKEIGWDATVADGKLDPNEQANQIRNAISAGADAIITVSLSCEAVPGAFQEARKAKVKLYGVFTRDCEDPQLDGKIKYADGVVDLAVEKVMPDIARWVIAKTDGKADIVQLFFNDGGALRDGGENFAKTIEAECPDCVNHKVPVTGQDIGKNRLQALTTAALTQNPNANVVVSPVDGIILLGAGAAVGEATAQGRKILLTGLEGLEPNLKMIEAGGPQSLAAGSPGAWHGWAAIDGLNRIFSGKPEVDPGIGYQLIDKEHPAPTIPYDGNKRSLGWKDNYRQIWGVKGAS